MAGGFGREEVPWLAAALRGFDPGGQHRVDEGRGGSSTPSGVTASTWLHVVIRQAVQRAVTDKGRMIQVPVHMGEKRSGRWGLDLQGEPAERAYRGGGSRAACGRQQTRCGACEGHHVRCCIALQPASEPGFEGVPWSWGPPSRTSVGVGHPGRGGFGGAGDGDRAPKKDRAPAREGTLCSGSAVGRSRRS